MAMTAEEAIAYIESYGWSTTRLGLSRTRELLARLGNPQRRLKFIHVAGSNGKGSACAMLDAILQAAGYRVGLYISPYIQVFNERICINGAYIPGDRLAEITERVMAQAEAMEDHPSQFELVTAIGMVYFVEEACDLVVLEVGMGGELDSTNAIDAPEAALIMNIGLEHTEYLGNTLEEIAHTKAGIIKTGCHAVCYDGAPEVTKVIKEVCAERQVPLTLADRSQIQPLHEDLFGQDFIYRDQPHHLSLIGPHQLMNASVVLETVGVLRERGWQISDRAVNEGLSFVSWPARFEVLSRDPLFILDGGHNPQCAAALAASIKALLPGRRILFLLGVLRDKDYDGILDLVQPLGERFFCLTPVSPRAMTGAALADHIRERGGQAEACDSIEEGIHLSLERAEEEDAVVVAFGSLYLAGAVRTAFTGAAKDWLRRRCVRAREALSEAERDLYSRKICERITGLEAYQKAKTVMLYRWVRGEVRLDALAEAAAAAGKVPVYPVCGPDGQMLAVIPGNGADAFKCGAFGIAEPDPEKGQIVPPEDLDLIVCPCTAFDEDLSRLGMGGGYYDRFLPKALKAVRLAAAFEVQHRLSLPGNDRDQGMDLVVTEDKIYTGGK